MHLARLSVPVAALSAQRIDLLAHLRGHLRMRQRVVSLKLLIQEGRRVPLQVARRGSARLWRLLLRRQLLLRRRCVGCSPFGGIRSITRAPMPMPLAWLPSSLLGCLISRCDGWCCRRWPSPRCELTHRRRWRRRPHGDGWWRRAHRRGWRRRKVWFSRRKV